MLSWATWIAQPSFCSDASSSVSFFCSVSRFVELSSPTTMVAALAAPPLNAAERAERPVSDSLGTVVSMRLTSETVRSLASTARASVRTTDDGVPEGGETVIESCFCEPAFRNCVGMWGTSAPAPTTSTAATPMTAQRLRRLASAAFRSGV